MPIVIISGSADAYAENPRAKKPTDNRELLLQLHGLVSKQACVETFDEPPLNAIGITGGHLRFEVAPDRPVLRVTSTYQVPRPLTEVETKLLVEATESQWSDGIGGGSFKNHHGTVLSTTLAMAILNREPKRTDLGHIFVDAYPIGERETRVETLDSDTPRSDIDYLKEAAEYGDVHSQYVLARRLAEGDGIEQSEGLAFEYFQKAADAGHRPALTFLGLCHQRGSGTSVDLKKAFDCFQTTANLGFPFAMHCLGEAYMEGRGVEANPEEGIRWYRRGVELGNLGCTAELAACYDDGKGVPQDLSEALRLYQVCLDGGFEPVAPAVERLKKQLGRA